MGFKVVINKCYGGFGISEKGVEWLLDNGADPTKVRVEDAGLASRYKYTICYLERHHPLLVKMVEALGSEAASGDHARLEIREIDQPLYRIDEYDGAESIEVPEGITWDNAHFWVA